MAGLFANVEPDRFFPGVAAAAAASLGVPALAERTCRKHRVLEEARAIRAGCCDD
jgi:hypothetical protein